MKNEGKIIKEIIKANEIVDKMLEKYPRCRDDDLFLVYKVWTEGQKAKIYIPFDKFKELIAIETITRCRRKIQNDENRHMPTDPTIAKKRRLKEDVYQRFYGKVK